MITAFIWPAALLFATATVALAALTAWRDWLGFKRLELASRGGLADEPATGVRIEMADLKERLRKLEAIATGVDL